MSELDDPGLRETGDLVAGLRPVPAPRFRGALGRRLQAQRPRSRPPSLAPRVTLLLVLGLLLLALAAAGLAGAGPLAL
jgi:hypothetical protein